MIEKILAGKMQKFYSDVCLLNQVFIKDDKITINQLIQQSIATIGENIQVKEVCQVRVVGKVEDRGTSCLGLFICGKMR